MYNEQLKLQDYETILKNTDTDNPYNIFHGLWLYSKSHDFDPIPGPFGSKNQ